MLKTVSIHVTGKVQAVWYRKYTVDKAVELNITGFVKNLPDDSVYIVATGTAEQVMQLADWCWTGSPRSKVNSVTVDDVKLQEFEGFRIVR